MIKLKRFILLFLTFILISCTIPEDKFDANKEYAVGLITQVCTTLEVSKKIHTEYSKSFEKGLQEFYQRIFDEKCILFPQPVLAKFIKLEFKGPISDNVEIEIWKVILDENPEDGKEITYFWAAIQKEKQEKQSEPEKVKDTEV
tara:strand:+ start:201 stop:632 length:432 start_codon:yes stop_codon:yes gene_type:complete